MVHPGLEEVAADEITRDLGGEVKKHRPRPRRLPRPRHHAGPAEAAHHRGRVPARLGHRRAHLPRRDLDKIERWTAREPDWGHLLRLHHAVRPKPKGKPTYRLVTQMEGKHGYRRIDARKALARGLAGKFPASWQPADENAAVEVWLTIDGKQAVCGLRLSDATMRHRTYKHEHLPASLRPTVAGGDGAAGRGRAGRHRPRPDVRGRHHPGRAARHRLAAAGRRGCHVLGGDLDAVAVRAAASTCERVGPRWRLARWDARRLPLAGRVAWIASCATRRSASSSLDPEEVGPLYRRLVAECDRVLKPGGRAVLLVGDAALLAGGRGGPRLAVPAAAAPARPGPAGRPRRLAEARRGEYDGGRVTHPHPPPRVGFRGDAPCRSTNAPSAGRS